MENKTFNLTSSIDDLYTYNPKNDRINKNIVADIDIDQDFIFGQQIKSKYFSFKLEKTNSFNLEKIKENNIFKVCKGRSWDQIGLIF